MTFPGGQRRTGGERAAQSLYNFMGPADQPVFCQIIKYHRAWTHRSHRSCFHPRLSQLNWLIEGKLSAGPACPSPGDQPALPGHLWAWAAGLSGAVESSSVAIQSEGVYWLNRAQQHIFKIEKNVKTWVKFLRPFISPRPWGEQTCGGGWDLPSLHPSLSWVRWSPPPGALAWGLPQALEGARQWLHVTASSTSCWEITSRQRSSEALVFSQGPVLSSVAWRSSRILRFSLDVDSHTTSSSPSTSLREISNTKKMFKITKFNKYLQSP